MPFFEKHGGESALTNDSRVSTFFDNNSSNSHTKIPFFSNPFVQTKLTIGPPMDKYEREAEAMADHVVQRLSENNDSTEQPVLKNSTGIQQKPIFESKADPKIQTKSLNGRSLYTTIIQPKCGEGEKLQKKEESSEEEELQMKPIFESAASLHDEDSVQRDCAECGTKEETLQIKAEGTDALSASLSLESRVQSSKGSGSSLPEDTRSQMERAFGSDFSEVRVHTDSSAVQMNKDLGAQAFTHDSDVYFNAGKYDVSSRDGQRLLGHELTHVVQQGGVIQRNILQKAPKKKDFAYIAVAIQVSKPMTREEFIILFLQKRHGFTKEKAQSTLETQSDLFTGPWAVTQEEADSGIKRVKVQVESRKIVENTASETISEPRMPNGRREGYNARKNEFDKLAQKEKDEINSETNKRYWNRTDIPEGEKIEKGEEGNAEIWLDIRDEVLAQRRFIKNLPEKAKKFFIEEKGGIQITPENFEQITRIANRIILSLTDNEVDEYMASNPKPAENLDQLEHAIEEYIKLKRTTKTDDPASDDDVKGEDNDEDDKKKKAGSKYGVGLWDLELPQAIIDALEATLEVLGDEEEMEAISETLRSLKDLSEQLDSIQLWFQNPSKLIPVVLGLEDNKAIESIEKWVEKPAKKKKFKPNKSKNRLVNLAKKLINLVEKLRKILAPIFKVRQDFVNVFASIAGLVEAVPMAGFLMEKIDQGKPLDDSLVRDFTNDLISRLQLELEGIRKMFALTPESFNDTDFVSYEDLAGAITHAVVKSIKHPAVKAASYIPGLENAIADNIVAEFIPKSALTSINGIIQNIVGPNVSAVSKAVGSDLEKLLNEVEQPLISSLKEDIPKLVQKSPKDGNPNQDSNLISDLSEDYMDKSQGEQMPEDTLRQMETGFQRDFSKVRFHDNPYSYQANESLRANAFTVGDNIFFGENKFRPEDSEGQRLIAHELTHTIQQSNGQKTGVVQRDYKEYLESLKGILSKNVLAGLKPGKTTDPALEKQAKEIADILQKVAGGKGNKGKGAKITKTSNGFSFPYQSLIEQGYVLYKLDKKGIPTRIRRRRKFTSLLPSLTIKSGRIKLGVLEKPKNLHDAARKALRRNLIFAGECRNSSSKEAHHVVPLELRNLKIVSIAESNNWNINGANNGVCLSKNIHSGSHSVYTGKVRNALLVLERSLIKKHGKVDWKNGKQPFEVQVAEFKKELKKRRSKLK